MILDTSFKSDWNSIIVRHWI